MHNQSQIKFSILSNQSPMLSVEAKSPSQSLNKYHLRRILTLIFSYHWCSF